MTRWRRFARFNAVSAIGVVVQLATIAVLVHAAGADYRVATVAGVSAAVAHNFLWHARWTWRDRAPTDVGLAVAFGRFTLANGMVSMIGNVAIMALLVGLADLPPVAANVIAIAACGLVNFELGDRVVFEAQGPGFRAHEAVKQSSRAAHWSGRPEASASGDERLVRMGVRSSGLSRGFASGARD